MSKPLWTPTCKCTFLSLSLFLCISFSLSFSLHHSLTRSLIPSLPPPPISFFVSLAYRLLTVCIRKETRKAHCTLSNKTHSENSHYLKDFKRKVKGCFPARILWASLAAFNMNLKLYLKQAFLHCNLTPNGDRWS